MQIAVGHNGLDTFFLYGLFIFQLAACSYGIFIFYKKLYGPVNYKIEKSVGHKKMIIHIWMIFFNLFWMNNTRNIINLDFQLKSSGEEWNPYKILDIENSDVFDTPLVKKAYRK